MGGGFHNKIWEPKKTNKASSTLDVSQALIPEIEKSNHVDACVVNTWTVSHTFHSSLKQLMCHIFVMSRQGCWKGWIVGIGVC